MALILCRGLIYFAALVASTASMQQAFYRLSGTDNEVKVEDENIPFVTQSFFTCSTNDDCTKASKKKGKSQFKEVTGQEANGEDLVSYKKIMKGKWNFQSSKYVQS